MFHLSAGPETELRLMQLADAPECFAAVARSRASLREWLPWVDRTHSAEDIREYVRGIVLPQFEAGSGPICGIRHGGEWAGSIGCHAIDWANRGCSIGYWLEERHRGKGLMTRCCAALLDYLFTDLRLHRVMIRCATGNTRSCAIPERLGFRREGLERAAEWVAGGWLDLRVWAMLEDEWRDSPYAVTSAHSPLP